MRKYQKRNSSHGVQDIKTSRNVSQKRKKWNEKYTREQICKTQTGSRESLMDKVMAGSSISDSSHSWIRKPRLEAKISFCNCIHINISKREIKMIHWAVHRLKQKGKLRRARKQRGKEEKREKQTLSANKTSSSCPAKRFEDRRRHKESDTNKEKKGEGEESRVRIKKGWFEVKNQLIKTNANHDNNK